MIKITSNICIGSALLLLLLSGSCVQRDDTKPAVNMEPDKSEKIPAESGKVRLKYRFDETKSNLAYQEEVVTEPRSVIQAKEEAGARTDADNNEPTVNDKKDSGSDTVSEVKLEGVTVNAGEEKLLLHRGAESVKEQNIFYDKSNESYALLQKANESMAGFPVNRVGEVDWVKAISRELINPRSSLTGMDAGKRRDDVIILKNTREMPKVRFPHSTHSYWLDCSNCHDSIFIPRAGANRMNMDSIFRGEYCGVCHNKVAFTTYMCETCHSDKTPGN